MVILKVKFSSKLAYMCRIMHSMGYYPMTTCPEFHVSHVCRPNEKSENELIQKIKHRYTGIYLTTEENPEKRQLGDLLIKAVRSVIASNGVSYLHMTSVVSHRTQGR